MVQRTGRTLLAALLAVSLVPTPALAWGNGCDVCNPGFPYYGVHDAIAMAALAHLKRMEPAAAKFLENWVLPFGGDYAKEPSFSVTNVKPAPGDNFLAWTDDPDSAFKDHENHFVILHPRPGYSDNGAPGATMVHYNRTVTNLSYWILLGSVPGSPFEHGAAYNAGVLSHYVADVSQFGHTDSTQKDHTHPRYDPADRTYHGYYESETWNVAGLKALESALAARPAPPKARIPDVAAKVVEVAKYANARDGRDTYFRDTTGKEVVVGSSYAWALNRFSSQWDRGVSHQGMRGWDPLLWSYSVDNIDLAARTTALIWWSAYADARARVTLGGLVPLP